jgi:hypothetical protein
VFAALLSIALAVAVAATAPVPPPPVYRCTRASKPIVIDGKLDDEPWPAAMWTKDFEDLSETKRREKLPPLRTRAKMLWHEQFLYIAASLADPDVRAAMREHDSPLYREGAFEVFIDPDGDGCDYLELQINPNDATMDLLMSKSYHEGGKADLKFELAKLRHAVTMERDVGWVVELAIPLDEIRKLSPRSDDLHHWRMNLARAWRSGVDAEVTYTSWSPTGPSLHAPDRFGVVEFIESK